MAQPIKKSQIIALFGEKAGLKLLNWLDPCCNTFCESVAACGTTPPGGPDTAVQYNNNGEFDGDALFTRNPTTTETTIATSGTGTLLMVGIDNNTSIEINDPDQSIFIQALETMEFGDPESLGNGTTVIVEDVNKHIHLRAPLGQVSIGDSGSVGNDTVIEVDDLTELVKITNVPTFADDAAAAVGGLVTGNLYKTTTGGSTFLKIVP